VSYRSSSWSGDVAGRVALELEGVHGVGRQLERVDHQYELPGVLPLGEPFAGGETGLQSDAAEPVEPEPVAHDPLGHGDHDAGDQGVDPGGDETDRS
jgi:hypothetical protein